MTRSLRSFALTAAAAAVLTWSSPAQAQTDNPWSVSFDLGTQIAVSGDAHGGANGTVLGLATAVTAKSYGDVFGPGFYWQAGLGYKLRPNSELRVAANYTANAADRLQVGTVAGLQLNAAFHDYKAFGMDFGFRQYYGGGKVRPYAGANVGFTRISGIDATLTVPAANVTLSNVPFYSDSTVPSFSFGGGAQVHFNDRLAFQAGVDLRWHGDLKQNEGLAGTGLQSINDESRRWAMPVMGGLTVKF